MHPAVRRIWMIRRLGRVALPLVAEVRLVVYLEVEGPARAHVGQRGLGHHAVLFGKLRIGREAAAVRHVAHMPVAPGRPDAHHGNQVPVVALADRVHPVPRDAGHAQINAGKDELDVTAVAHQVVRQVPLAGIAGTHEPDPEPVVGRLHDLFVGRNVMVNRFVHGRIGHLVRNRIHHRIQARVHAVRHVGNISGIGTIRLAAVIRKIRHVAGRKV
jgi:hypothetical protein